MHPLMVLVGLLTVAKPAAAPSKSTAKTKPPVSLPMPPPPAGAATPPPADSGGTASPGAASASASPTTARREAIALDERPLLSRLRVGAGLGPGFSLSSGLTSGSPVWWRVSLRGVVDLLRLGPGQVQVMVPIALQGTGFNAVAGPVSIPGSVFGLDVMPSARFQMEVLKDVALYAELGLGFGAFQVTIQQPFTGYVTSGAGGLGTRVGAGLEYRLAPSLSIILQPMELTALSVTTSTTVGGTTVTTTTSASQWSMVLGATYQL